jgi:hypothetical protein
MTYLNLINAVLSRLRESTANAPDISNNPFYNMIASAVNDAKESVEDSWEWGALRNADAVTVPVDTYDVILPNSADSSYQISRVVNNSTGGTLTPLPLVRIESLYSKAVPGSTFPTAYGFIADLWDATDDSLATNGQQRIRLSGPASEETVLTVHNTKRQAPLSVLTARLKVPAAPVYLLATALASRERGEIGGTPTSELFVLADRALSSAIAIDSARFSEELFWYNPSDMSQSNVGTA